MTGADGGGGARGEGAAGRLSTHVFLVGVLDRHRAQEQDQQEDAEMAEFQQLGCEWHESTR